MEFTKLARCINQQSKNTNNFIFGVVKLINPLTIAVNGLDFTDDDFLMNSEIKEKNITLNNYFSVGNKVLFLNNSGELILLCKVV